MRRRGKKVKQIIKEDKFRDGVISLTKKIEQNKFFFITLAVAIVLFCFGFHLRSQRRASYEERLAQMLESPESISIDALKAKIDEYSNKEFAPWLWLAYGQRLLTEYREEGMQKCDKSKLFEAEKAFKVIIERFKDSGTPYQCANERLSVIEQEKKFEFPWKSKQKTEQKGDYLNWSEERFNLHITFLKESLQKESSGS
jgi:hypothetical protein